MEGFQGKHLKCLSADLIEKYSCFFFSSFQKVPKHLMYDGLSHFGHLLSLPSSTYQGGYFFFFLCFRVQNWPRQQQAATQLCKECHGWQLPRCRGIGWAFLVKQHCPQEAWCHWDPPWGYHMPLLLEKRANPPSHVAQCLVLTTMTLALG